MKTRLLLICIILVFVAVNAKAAASITETGAPAITSNTYGTAGATSTFTVSGIGLTAGITVSSSVTGLELSTNATSGFANSIVVGAAPTVATTTIYIRITSTANQTYYTPATITCSSTGAASQTFNTSYVVNAAPLTITLNVPNKTYGNTYTSGSGSSFFTPTGLKNGETVGSVTVNYYGGGTAANAAVGTYSNVQVSGATGGTFTASNYNITYSNGSGSFNVVAKALTITSAAASNKPYDGTNAATITGTLSGIVSGDVVTLNGTGTFASINVGTGIAVTSTCTLSGANAGNYTLTQPTGLTANITQGAVTVTANAVTKTYGTAITGGSGSTAFTTSGLASGETIGSVTIAYGTGSSSTDAAGTYTGTVTPSAATGGTFTASNYTISYIGGNIIVSPKALTISSAAGSNKTYDGTTAATITGTLSGVINSDVVTLVGTGTFASANVGTNIAITGTCTLSGANAGNYTVTQPTGLKANITKAALTVTATGPQYTAYQYMSTTTGSTTNFTYSGTVNGETVTSVTLTPNPNYTAVAAGTSYTVTPSAAAGSSPFSTGNYTITYVAYSGVVGTAYTWTGYTNQKWSVSTNWLPNGVPTSHDNVTIPTTGNTPTVDVTSACGTMTISGTTTLTLSAQLTANGALTITAAYPFTIAGTNSVSFSGLTDIGYGSSFTINSGPTVTFNANSSVNNSSSQNNITNNGTLNFNSNCNFQSGYNCGITNGGTINATSTTINVTSGNITNTGTLTVTGGSISLGNNNNYLKNIGSPSTVTLTNCAVTLAGANAYISNTSNFTATNSSFTFGNQNTITNTGTFKAQTGCVFTMNTSGTCMVTNNGTYTDIGSTYNIGAQTGNITNSGTGVSMHLTGTTITYSGGTAASFNNTSNAILTADGSTVMTFTTQAGTLNNTTGAIFNAGVSQSPCLIYIYGQAAGIANSSTFNLGSTSYVLNGGYKSIVTNSGSGVFTLESDKYGSATFGSIPAATGSTGGGSFSGTFNVQRYLTGGSTGYRAYRLLSSPVNQSSNNQGTGSYNIAYLNTNATVVNPNGVVGTTTYNGGLTAGPGGTGSGFTVPNANPIIYLYNESVPSSNSSFVSGKFAGITKVSASTVDVLAGTTTTPSVSIPAGNGYLYYFIGDNSSTVTSNTRVPNATTITATGTINQNSANGSSSNTYTPVTLWWNSASTLSYTPSNPASNATGNSAGGAGFNLLGNPYPSVIDLHQLWSDNGSPAYVNFYELVDINPNQPYVSYNASTGAKSSPTYSSQYIASGQGFFVQATATGQSVIFKEDQKVYNTSLLNSTSTTPILLNAQNPVNFKLPGQTSYAALPQAISAPTGLHIKLIMDTTSFDECGIYFHTQGSDNYNINDAVDLDGVAPKVFMSSITADGIRTGINTLADYTTGKRIKLYVRSVYDGIYKLNLEDIFNIDTVNYKVYLLDKKLNDSLDMVHYKTYTFNFSVADTASFSNRFLLAIEPKALPPYNLITFAGQKGGTNAVDLNWKTANEGVFTTFGVEKLDASGKYVSIDSLQSTGAGYYTFKDQNAVNGNNIYRLAQNDIYGKVTYAGPINITFNANSANGLFTIYPNPSKDIINVAVNSAVTGSQTTPTYLASIYNLAGVTMDSKQINTNNWTQDVTGYKAGVYILELKTTDGNIVGKAKFVKTN